MPADPQKRFPMAGGGTADLYLLRYDKEGALLSPQAQAAFENAATDASDVFVMAHGWNNTFDIALDRYTRFIEGYMRQRSEFGSPVPAGYRPLLLGVIWPSTSMVLPWEQGPKIAGQVESEDAAAQMGEEMLRLVGTEMSDDDRMALLELVDGRHSLTVDDARKAAALVAPTIPGDEGEFGGRSPKASELLASWQALSAGSSLGAISDDDFGTVRTPTTTGADPEVAGLRFDPRDLLRVATVWLMKDRSGAVGALGLGPLLGRLLATADGPRVHMVGHSFGARVVLSAAAAMPPPARPAHSMLLLQAAINRWCFADDVPGTGQRGGYSMVPDRVDLPILSTFSSFDVPLTRMFHLAIRGHDLGELRIAAGGNTDLYGALGGFGPAGLGEQSERVAAAVPGAGSYPLESGASVIAVDGSVTIGAGPAISGHGDISNSVTWWALHQLTAV
ncbi:MAG: hypothetical protein ACOYEV_02970 [Candidatus Nanopelagicales bacterium]